jgi:hypothetical protein
MYDFDLIVTTYKKNKELNNFLNSVLAQSHKLKIRVILLNQNEYPIKKNIFKKKLKHPNIKLIELNIGKKSLSEARNLGLKYGLQSKFVAFPDDDCWYNEETLIKIKSYLNNNKAIDIISTCVWDPIANRSLGNRPKNVYKKISYLNIFKYPISVGLFFRSNFFYANSIYFDENYGAGTALGSGEETELLARALSLNTNIFYNGFISVFHLIENQNINLKKIYSYSYGFGFLVTEMSFKYKKITFLNFFYVLGMTLLAFIVRFHIKVYRDKYCARIRGLFVGCYAYIKPKKK